MADPILKIERHQNYATLTLNRPDKRNALNVGLLAAINDGLAQFENDKEIRALVLRGEGSGFCSGIDLAELHETEGGHNPNSIEAVFGRLERFPVPTIAAVHGPALAGGLELALHCDLRVAADNAKLGMTVARVGLIVPYDFIRKLIEICGAANTAMILYTADLFDARKGLELGLVHEVVADAKLADATAALAEKVSAAAPLPLRGMKATIRRCMSESYNAYHDDLLKLARDVRSSRDAKEGVRAFVEKRKPVWRAE
ncbi:MAG TPA: enoyl-CoA hydratase/isomerase family protein [Candidatus Binataceae bacterium]|nr:enoyl-CoA hydratase/isomerase family protein [Candidatus Binataceae bacterium]